MTAQELYHHARTLGFQLKPRGDKLIVIPGDCVPPDLVDALKQHKAELLAWLSRPQRAGWHAVPPDLALNPRRPYTVARDARRVVAYVVRQIGDRAGPLCEWLLRRENRYSEAFGWPDDSCIYASARDCACWQLQRGELELLELLEGFDEAARSTTCED